VKTLVAIIMLILISSVSGCSKRGAGFPIYSDEVMKMIPISDIMKKPQLGTLAQLYSDSAQDTYLMGVGKGTGNTADIAREQAAQACLESFGSNIAAYYKQTGEMIVERMRSDSDSAQTKEFESLIDSVVVDVNRDVVDLALKRDVFIAEKPTDEILNTVYVVRWLPRALADSLMIGVLDNRKQFTEEMRIQAARSGALRLLTENIQKHVDIILKHQQNYSVTNSQEDRIIDSRKRLAVEQYLSYHQLKVADGILFGTGKTSYKEKGTKETDDERITRVDSNNVIMDELIEYLKRLLEEPFGIQWISIHGHADIQEPIGNDDNPTISWMRAEYVRSYIVDSIPELSGRILTYGVGARMPEVPNLNECASSAE